ncbi:MAG: peptide chain release factor N(5)-glutamine methyltransferase [Ruminococcaceae bacterium]|nr:peptide chain release factor N(5)-glutamine methyltransferase [Oscillospiraceae bacterium]
MKIIEGFNLITKKLTEAGAESPAFDASELISFVLGTPYTPALDKETEMSDKDYHKLLTLAERRAAGEPLQYIIGQWEFYGYPFKVGKGVLIPRDDTEVALRASFEHLDKTENPKILDLCAGSGTLAVTLKKLYPNAEVTAVEISEDAFFYLRENANLNSADINMINGDIFKVYGDFEDKYFDLIISNPPYLTTQELKSMQRELYFEPELALDGGDDGMLFYRGIIPLYTPKLKSGGQLIFELDGIEAEYTRELMKAENYGDIEIFDDLGGIHRAIKGTLFEF